MRTFFQSKGSPKPSDAEPSPAHPSKSQPRHRLLRHLSRHSVQILLILAALLLGFRAALPYIVKNYVNRTLSRLDGYRGHVDDVDMHLWRGAYSVSGVNIVKTDGKVPVPFFAAKNIDFSVEWMGLFEGALVAKIEFDDPVINFVAGPSQSTTQVGVDKPWLSVIKDLFPLNINRFEVKNGAVHYRDFYAKPKVELTVDHIHMMGKNLTNSRRFSKTLVAELEMTGRAFESAPMKVTAKIDPSTEKATFELTAKLDPVPLSQFNEFTEAYAHFHFQKGTLELVCELAAKNGDLTGYVKPLLDNIAIIDLKDAKNPLKFAWESLVAGVTRLFRNQPHDRFATKIPISGSFDNPKAAILPALGNILRNEFIKVFTGNLDSSVTLQDVEKTTDVKAKPAESAAAPAQR